MPLAADGRGQRRRSGVVVARSWRTAERAALAFREFVLLPDYPAFLLAQVARHRRRSQRRREWSEFAIVAEAAALELVFCGKPIVLRFHRPYHRGCGKLCEARNLYAHALLGLPSDLNPKALPLRAIVIPRIERILDCKLPDSFHRDVWRDLNRLRTALSVAPKLRSGAQKRLARRYAGLVANQTEQGRQGPRLASVLADADLPAPARRFLQKAVDKGTIGGHSFRPETLKALLSQRF